MPSLGEVCVWEGFYEYIADTTESPNVCFQTDCNGDCSITGIENSPIEGYNIFPNPTYATFTLRLETPIQGELQIHNLNGQLIHSRPITSASEQIDMTSYPKGIYFVKLRSEEWVRTEKVVKY